MSKSDYYRPKLSILLREDQREKLNELLPWGSGTILFSAIIDELIPILEEYGHAAIGLIVSKKVSMLDFMKLKERKETVNGHKLTKAKKPSRLSTEGTNSTVHKDQGE